MEKLKQVKNQLIVNSFLIDTLLFYYRVCSFLLVRESNGNQGHDIIKLDIPD